MKKILLVAFIFFAFCQSLTAQERQNETVLNFRSEYVLGFLIPHNDRVSPLIDRPIQGVEFAVEFPKLGRKPWHFYYNFPTVGLALRYLDLGNRQMLGSAISFFPYVNIPIFTSSGGLFTVNTKIGGGLSFVTKKHDPLGSSYRDLNNFAISTNLNVFLNGGFNAELRLSQSPSNFASRFALTADANFQHISNGSVQKPNSGLNMVNFGLGLRYRPNPEAAPIKKQVPDIARNWSLEPVISIGMNEQRNEDTYKFLNASFSIGAFRPLSNIFRMGLNADFFYNAAFAPERESQRNDYGYDGRFRAGFSLANEFMFGDVALGIHVGAYVFNPLPNQLPTYFRLMAKYRIWDHLFVKISTKTHLNVAESLEVGFGYSFRRR